MLKPMDHRKLFPRPEMMALARFGLENPGKVTDQPKPPPPPPAPKAAAPAAGAPAPGAPKAASPTTPKEVK